MKPKTRPHGGPRIYPLPQSPTGWNEAYEGERASIGGPDADPERPGGVLGDAGGLPAAGDRARLARRGKRQKR
ncbi:MAG TPA: hypothetical protein VJV77_13550 [Casimicrobiaceae bacterium]|nr:hypothetical protein [Casimicrobiaceae bacterium]